MLEAINMRSDCDGSAWFAFVIAPRSTPSFLAIFSRSIFTHLPAGSILSKSGERMYMTRPWLPSKIISMLGSVEPIWS